MLSSYLFGWYKYIDFSYIKKVRAALRHYVNGHYWVSVAVFIAIYICTAFFMPGTIVLTLTGGFLFGVLPAALYINIGATTGAVIAFLVSRHLAGSWVREKYAVQMEPLNRAVERHAVSYIIALTVLPVLPSFAINYLAGLTDISLKTFIWTTSLGTLPGSLVYAYAGKQLGSKTARRTSSRQRPLQRFHCLPCSCFYRLSLITREDGATRHEPGLTSGRR